MNQQNSARNGSCTKDSSPVIETDDSDVEMDTEEVQNGHGDSCVNGKSNTNNGYQNGNSYSDSNNTNKNTQESSNNCDNDEDMGGYNVLYFHFIFCCWICRYRCSVSKTLFKTSRRKDTRIW